MNRSRRNDEEVSEFSEDTMDRPIPQNDVSFYHKQKQKAKRLGVLFLLSNIFVLILTALPVLMKFPDIYVEELRKDWFGIDDLIRMAEPLIALILQLLIFLESAVFNHYSISEGFESEAIIVVTVFAFSASLYSFNLLLGIN
jgi:UDP-N-acetylmuramyl pentapeptide phosphotransferase/UDP-N-acetylglucosamine-1-phosphate transferase